MNKKMFFGVAAILVLLVLVGYMLYKYKFSVTVNDFTPTGVITNKIETPISYRNNIYGFSVPLPESWRGYSATEKAQGSYIEIHIAHPQSTSENPRMDIPVLVVPIATWNKWYPSTPGAAQHPFAAPVPAMERARNNKYVFATAPRYNYSFATGYEEVDEIVKKITGFNVGSTQNQPVQQIQQIAPTETFPLFQEGEVKG
jgi:hypothetical protein